MDARTLFEQCQQSARLDPDTPLHPDALIGMFQAFRPDGIGLDDAFKGLAIAGDLFRRLERLYRDSGEDRRPQGGRDAYFVVRSPQPLEPSVAEATARLWLENLAGFAAAISDTPAQRVLSREIRIRVLQGIAPKHPKDAWEKSQLLETLTTHVPQWTQRFATTPESFAALDPVAVADDAGTADAERTRRLAGLLRSAYYFIACDAMLRDYLMWPLYQPLAEQVTGLPVDPFAPYYDLWRHGIKYRIFTDDQLDLYLPRHNTQR